MRAVIQRVTEARVTAAEHLAGEIGQGLVVLLGVDRDDNTDDAVYICNKIVHLRIFADDEGRMNRSLLEVQGEILLISQFTLLGNTRKGRRPNYMQAAAPAQAEALYEHAGRLLRAHVPVATGIFGAMMAVQLVNDGPVTLIIESP